MSREIIFRGKRIDNGKWLWGYYVCQMRYPNAREDVQHVLIAFSSVTDYLTPRAMRCTEIQADTLGQFTGLYDADGNRIFEGDIIKGKRGPVYVVEYCESIAGYLARAAEETTWTPSMNTGTMKSYKVIGNRWDNPELLGKEG